MLHLLAFPPDHNILLAQALQTMNSGDDVVLLDAGTQFAQSATALAKILAAAPNLTLHLLGQDAIADGVDVHRIDSNGLVALTEKHDASLSWYP